MNFTSTQIPYSETEKFSQIVLDYISGDAELRPFYKHLPNISGIENAIKERQKFPTNRKLLVEHLNNQYKRVSISPLVKNNIDSLINENVFTVCTAHQPNILTGHLYFIYKIVHAIKLASFLNSKFIEYKFVPVFYVGSEDADIDELGTISIDGKIYKWNTSQTGAVGRMKVDKALVELIDEVSNQVEVLPHGEGIMKIIKGAYKLDEPIERATLKLVNELFGEYGLIILLPDNPDLKRSFSPVIKKELLSQFSNKSVSETLKIFPEKYKVQTHGREINLFYLKDDLRERIEKEGDEYKIAYSELKFSKEEMNSEVQLHPERFSPNVILRPVFQEWILPDVAFIGGGGELAYWFELKSVFEETNVPMPVLILRNSYLFIAKKEVEKILKLNFTNIDIFRDIQSLNNELVSRLSENAIDVDTELQKIKEVYETLTYKAETIDSTLKKHCLALLKWNEDKIISLQKKMLRAEKKKYEIHLRQISDLKNKLFPQGILQERVDNLIYFYSLYGDEFIKSVYENALDLEFEFVIVEEK